MNSTIEISDRLAVRPLTPKLGAALTDVRLADDMSDELFHAIYQAFLRYQVLLFPPQDVPPARQVPTMFFSATKSDQRGEIYLKVVNAIGNAQTVQVDLAGAAKVAAEGEAIVLSSTRKEDTNTIAAPTKVVPVTSKASGLGKQFSYSFAPYSVTVLVLSTK
jgi:alpha-L-arabinofuranosidase